MKLQKKKLVWVSVSKGPCKRGNNVEKTLLRKQIFLRLWPQREAVVAEAMFPYREAKMCLDFFKKTFWLPQQMFSRLCLAGKDVE